MGFDTDLLDEAVDFASKIDFSSSKMADRVSVFETTFRYLGGLLWRKTHRVETSNTAEAGTLILEWATLSKHTGNDTYELAEKSLRHVAELPSLALPGLAAQGIDPTTGGVCQSVRC
ncbi:hypothetical protein BDZ89DRAFT_1147616 [Hymenopellis radicata]|nr:hypothetical protein BDZ89DRAFT_1147616 [Hymenopellis radicata]